MSKVTPKNPAPAAPLATPAPRPLTLKEKGVMEFLQNFMRENGIAPSYQEICQHFGFASFNSVQRYLRQLESKGYIHIPGGNQKRAITLLQSASAMQESLEEMHAEVRSSNLENFSLPLLGRVAAGAPIEALEHDEYIDVPASLVRHADRTYALRVQGQSMVEDGILDGDVILVQRQSYANNGEIVVAVVESEATVKRYYKYAPGAQVPALQEPENPRVGGAIELRPANSSMTSMWFAPSDVQLRGIVVGLIRKF